MSIFIIFNECQVQGERHLRGLPASLLRLCRSGPNHRGDEVHRVRQADPAVVPQSVAVVRSKKR